MSRNFVPFWRAPATVVPGLCATVAALSFAGTVSAGPEECPNPDGGDCFTETLGTPGCQNAECCVAVCDVEPFCCQVEWDAACVAQAKALCDAPCVGSTIAFSNLDADGGVILGDPPPPGATLMSVLADDLAPITGGLVEEISFSFGNFDSAEDPASPITSAVIDLVLISGAPNEPILPDDIIAEINVDLTGLFDPNADPPGEPLPPFTSGEPNTVVLTVEFEPEDGLFIPNEPFWLGVRNLEATFEGAGSLANVGQLLGINPPAVGASQDLLFIEGFGLAAFVGGDPFANLVFEVVVVCGPGACCIPETGECIDDVEELDCENMGGIFQGAGTLCGDIECDVVGACCLVSGECVDGLFEDECTEGVGGTWQGGLTECVDAECPDPCNLAVVAGGTDEGEACGMALNEGCNSKTQADFGAIACGETVNGTAWADGGTRDTDWYLIDVPPVDGTGMTRVNVSLSSQFPADSFILDVTDCAAVTLPDPDNNGVNAAPNCQSVGYSICVEPGQYAVFVGAAVPEGPIFEGVPCGSGANAYELSVECKPCDAEPGCPQDCVTSATFEPPPDGVVDGADLAVLLGDWGDCPGCCSDSVTSATFEPPPDGVVDGADLAVLLGAWGDPGCQD